MSRQKDIEAGKPKFYRCPCCKGKTVLLVHEEGKSPRAKPIPYRCCHCEGGRIASDMRSMNRYE